MSCCSQALQQWCGGTKPPIPTVHVILFGSKSGRLTQNQEKHSTVDENIRGWPKEKKSATLRLQSQLMGTTCTVYTDGLKTSDLTPLVSQRVIGCEGSEGKGFPLWKLGHRTQSKPTWYNNIKVSSVCSQSVSCYTAKFSIIVRIAWLHYFQAIGRHKVPLSFGTFFMYFTIFYDFPIFLPCECGIRKATGDTSDSQFLDWIVYPYRRRGAGNYLHVLWSWNEIAYTFTFQNYLIMSPLNLLTFSF